MGSAWRSLPPSSGQLAVFTRCFYSLFFPSPTDALIGLNVWCRMAALAPVRQGLHGLRTFSFHNFSFHNFSFQTFSLHTFTDPAWASAHSGGPHAGVMRGGSVSAPMCANM